MSVSPVRSGLKCRSLGAGGTGVASVALGSGFMFLRKKVHSLQQPLKAGGGFRGKIMSCVF